MQCYINWRLRKSSKYKDTIPQSLHSEISTSIELLLQILTTDTATVVLHTIIKAAEMFNFAAITLTLFLFLQISLNNPLSNATQLSEAKKVTISGNLFISSNYF